MGALCNGQKDLLNGDGLLDQADDDFDNWGNDKVSPPDESVAYNNQ